MSERLTPLLAQYRRIKERHKDTLLLFRVGDFYEMFYEDAAIGARALGLTLTSRPHGPDNRIPLAGVPARAVEGYVARLVNQGFRVALCDQLEPAAPNKPVVRRDVVEVITPGTLTSTGLLDARRDNFLCALSPAGDRFGAAFADVSTGEFLVAEFDADALAEEVQRIDPRELLLPQGAELPRLDTGRPSVTRLDDYYFTQDYAFDKLTSHFGVVGLDGFGIGAMTEGICAAGAVLHYLEETQRARLGHLRRPLPYVPARFMLIDRATRRNLEIVERIHSDERAAPLHGTLLGVLDRTVTPAGSRLLRRWILAPLVDVAAITARHDAVEELNSGGLGDSVRAALEPVGDLERLTARIALERASPREVASVAAWLGVVPAVRQAIAPTASSLLKEAHASIEDFAELVRDITATLTDDPPAVATEGGVIRPGASPELDELRSLAAGARDYIARLQESERQRTGIPNLRVRFNSVFGYYIEVTKSYVSQVPKDYLRKQTVVNGERYITPELKDYETRVLNAEERIKALELELFAALRRRVGAQAERIIRLAGILARLDALSALARAASENRYVRPRVDDSLRLELVGARHPVVETLLDGEFIGNDTELDPDATQIMIITGPNMAGKSTYLRQVALAAIMAQAGSFVPAQSARIGVIDKVFTRIGASDDLARGVSTFLAEMIETANILNNATDRSLVILDEVGRGTATGDGLAIAWAAVEYLHGGCAGAESPHTRPPDIRTGTLDSPVARPLARPKTLFATHYHELCDITATLPHAENYSFSVRETRDTVLFLRKLKPGPADQSYGIAVARLAGLPPAVIRRAREVLAGFMRAEADGVRRIAGVEPPDVALAADRPPQDDPLVDELLAIDIDKLAPLDALNLLAQLQRAARQRHRT